MKAFCHEYWQQSTVENKILKIVQLYSCFIQFMHQVKNDEFISGNAKKFYNQQDVRVSDLIVLKNIELIYQKDFMDEVTQDLVESIKQFNRNTIIRVPDLKMTKSTHEKIPKILQKLPNYSDINSKIVDETE